jgi:hypothetical protein
VFDKQDGQHLAQLLLISKMRNLANDISHDRSNLTAKIFGATTTRHFLTISIWNKVHHIIQKSNRIKMRYNTLQKLSILTKKN